MVFKVYRRVIISWESWFNTSMVRSDWFFLRSDMHRPVWLNGWVFVYELSGCKLMMMVMNCFCGMVDRREAFSLISSRDHCQRFSPSRNSNSPQAGFEPAQNLNSGFVEWSCALVITTTPRRYKPRCLYTDI